MNYSARERKTRLSSPPISAMKKPPLFRSEENSFQRWRIGIQIRTLARDGNYRQQVLSDMALLHL